MLSLQRVNYYKTTFFVIPKYLDCISFNQLIMNTLEQKCAVLANTPQSLWFDMRYKALAQLLMNMEDDGLITLKELPPIPQLSLYGLNFTIGVFKYDGEYYFIEVNPTGEWGWLVHTAGFEIQKAIVDALEGL